jgi:hypothetical protein
MQIVPLRQELECSRMKQLRSAAQPRKPHRVIRLPFRRHS